MRRTRKHEKSGLERAVGMEAGAQLIRDRARGKVRTAPKKRSRIQGAHANLSRLRQQLRERATQQRLSAGARGWRGRGGGSTTWMEVPQEWISTSYQVPGMWPWAAGHQLPLVGVPIGRHLENGMPVCGDPISWFLKGLTNAPTGFVMGRMGLGKSTLIRHLCTCLEYKGVIPIVMSDTRPDYVEMVKAMGGQVISLGPGESHLNPLDPGPLLEHLDALDERGDDKEMRKCLAMIRARRINAVCGLLEIGRGAELQPHERQAITRCIDILDEEYDEIPVLGDLRELIENRHPQVMQVVSRVSVGGGAEDAGQRQALNARYDDRVEDLLTAIGTVDVGGSFGDTFGRQTDERIDLGRPVVFDLSEIDDEDELRLGAVQYVTWSQATQALSAAKFLSAAGILPQRTYLMVGDELYRALRALPLIVRRVDSIIRMIRKLGAGLLLCTHTMNDLNLDGPEGPLTKIAWGFVERSDMCFLGGLARQEMGNLATVWSLSGKEEDDITGWSDMPDIDPDGEETEPPGRAKFLLKLGRSAGIPFRSFEAPTSKAVEDSNRAWDTERQRLLRSRGDGGIAA